MTSKEPPIPGRGLALRTGGVAPHPSPNLSNVAIRLRLPRLGLAASQSADLLPEDCELNALRQAGLEMLFRIDGINQVKYITDDEVKARIRLAAKRLMLDEMKVDNINIW